MMKNILVAHLRGQKVPKLALFVVFILFTSFYIIYRQPNNLAGKKKNSILFCYVDYIEINISICYKLVYIVPFYICVKNNHTSQLIITEIMTGTFIFSVFLLISFINHKLNFLNEMFFSIDLICPLLWILFFNSFYR